MFKPYLSLHPAVCLSDLTFPCGSLVPDTSAKGPLSAPVKLSLLRLTLSNPPRLSWKPCQIRMLEYSHTGLVRPEASCHTAVRTDSMPNPSNTPREDAEVHVPLFLAFALSRTCPPGPGTTHPPVRTKVPYPGVRSVTCPCV